MDHSTSTPSPSTVLSPGAAPASPLSSSVASPSNPSFVRPVLRSQTSSNESTPRRARWSTFDRRCSVDSGQDSVRSQDPSRKRTSSLGLALQHSLSNPTSPLASPSRTHFGDLSSPGRHGDHHDPPGAHHHHAQRRRSSTALSMRSFVTITRTPLPSPPLSPQAVFSPLKTLTDLQEKENPSPYAGSGSEDDPYIVCFGPDDTEDPRRWRTSYRWFIMSCATVEMTCGTLAISLFTSGFTAMKNEFGVKREIVVLSTTLYLLALAISSLITAPLGELYGRKPVMAVSFLLFTVFNAAVSLSPNIGALLALRFISGFFGSAAMSHGPAMASDLFSEHEIALPLTLAGVGRFGGPVIGPLIGGWIQMRVGWRWLGWTMTVFSGICTLVAAFLVPETYAPALLRKRARRLASRLGATHITSYDAGRAIGGWKAETKQYLVRPFMFLTMEPIVLLLSLHVSFLYGILNLDFTAYPYIFSMERGWNAGMAGLPFIAVIVGFFFSVPIALAFAKVYKRAAQQSPTGQAAPEQRLWFGILGAGLLPISLFWLGWSANPDVHWMAPVASGVLFSVGQLGLTQSVFTYFSDAYTYQMGSVLAGSNFMRFAFGGVFPLFSLQMFQKLGSGWSLTLLGILCVVFFPAPVCFYIYGERIRKWSKLVPSVPIDPEASSSPAESTAPHSPPQTPRVNSPSAVSDTEDGGEEIMRTRSERGMSRRPSVVQEEKARWAS